jgi:hypothetical protein
MLAVRSNEIAVHFPRGTGMPSAGKPNMSAVRRGFAGQFRVETWTVYLALLVSGCAGSMGTMHSGLPPPPHVTSFDGSYRNTIHVTDSFGVAQTTSWCDSPGQHIITVANGQFSYAVPHPNVPGQATPAFPATMAQDGSFYGQVVGGTISGRVQGTRIEGRIDGSACLYTFVGHRT